MLARQPSWHILTYKGYEINENTFYTLAQDKRSTNQNSGVRIDATDPNGNKQTYYGRIEEIWELNYAPTFKVPLFKCQWVKATGGRVAVDNQYGMTTVDLNNIGYKNLYCYIYIFVIYITCQKIFLENKKSKLCFGDLNFECSYLINFKHMTRSIL